MEIKHMHVVMALTIVFLIALFFFLEESAKPPGQTPAEIAESLLFKGISFGENRTVYSYSYNEYSDGFKERYDIRSNGNESMVRVTSPLSVKSVYFLGNDTIMCLDFRNERTCASVVNETITANYISSLEGRLFQNQNIAKTREDTRYRLDNSLQFIRDSVATKTLQSGERCTEISYVIDYENATIEEMGRFNIVPGSPLLFESKNCIANDTGEVFEYTFNYTYKAKLHTTRFELIGSDFDSPVHISTPSNLSNDLIDKLLIESGYKTSLLNCYLQSGSEQERCIATLALELKEKSLCSYSGARKDRCLISVVAETHDEEICDEIESQEFKDDCFTEFAWAYKDSSYCDKVQDPAKKADCLDAASGKWPEVNATVEEGNQTVVGGNETSDGGFPIEIQQIIDDLENQSVNTSGNTS